MNKIPLVSFKEEFKILKNEYIKSFENQLEKAEFIGGSAVTNFEEKIKKFFNVEHAIGVGNGTDALLIALESLKIINNYEEKKKEIIVPAFSFFATSEALVKAGFEPLFIDIDITTGNLDVNQIERNMTENVVGIVPVHLFGKSAELKKIIEIANKYNLFIVEDVAQAFGASYNEKLLGTFGNAGCFSFFPSKNLGAFGDGGMIVTNDSQIAKYSKMLRNHGAEQKYQNKIFGYNSRLDSIQANFLSIKLDHIKEFIKSRQKIGQYYANKLNGNSNITLLNYENSSFNYFTIKANHDRDGLIKYLDSKSISTAIYYPVPLPNLEAHSEKNKMKTYKEASELSKTILSLPIWPMMDLKLVDRVVDEINNFYK